MNFQLLQNIKIDFITEKIVAFEFFLLYKCKPTTVVNIEVLQKFIRNSIILIDTRYLNYKDMTDGLKHANIL